MKKKKDKKKKTGGSGAKTAIRNRFEAIKTGKILPENSFCIPSPVGPHQLSRDTKMDRMGTEFGINSRGAYYSMDDLHGAGVNPAYNLPALGRREGKKDGSTRNK